MLTNLVEYVKQNLEPSNDSGTPILYPCKVGQYCNVKILNEVTGQEYHVEVKVTNINESGWPGFFLEDILNKADIDPNDIETITRLHFSLE